MNRSHVIISIILGALAIVFVSVYFVWFAPANFAGTKYIFVVEKGQSISAVIASLKEEGFIRSEFGTKVAFRLNRASSVQAGTYNVSPRMDAWQIANILGASETATVRVTIPEGYTVNQIAGTLNDKGVITASDFINAAKDYSSDLELLMHRTSGSLEGYLFPDTYNMNRGTPAQDLIGQMLDNFVKRVEPVLLSPDSRFNVHQIITLASLVEKEARTDEDRKLIAGVLMNRLAAGMRLDVDATVRYIINDWDNPITQSDLNIDSPYNTRKYAGLPPGPICNPGLAAIQAVVSPTDSNYLYYLHDAEGNTYYAKTLEQHNAHKAKHL